jgi:hypothetical protein
VVYYYIHSGSIIKDRDSSLQEIYLLALHDTGIESAFALEAEPFLSPAMPFSYHLLYDIDIVFQGKEKSTI